MEIKRKDFFLGRIALSIVISTIIFIIFFLLSNSFLYLLLDNSEKNSLTIQENLDEFSQNENVCNMKSFFKISQLLYEEGKRISFLEEKFGKNNERVRAQKEKYFQLEIIHFLYVKELNKKCNSSLVPILFFYSNMPEFLDESEIKGFILEKFYEKNKNRVIIYSFDFDLNSKEVEDIVKKYNVTGVSVFLGESAKRLEFNEINRYLLASG